MNEPNNGKQEKTRERQRLLSEDSQQKRRNRTHTFATRVFQALMQDKIAPNENEYHERRKISKNKKLCAHKLQVHYIITYFIVFI